MTTPQIAAVVIFLAVIVAIMTEKIHRAVAATAGAVLLLLIGILDVNSAVSYIDFNTVVWNDGEIDISPNWLYENGVTVDSVMPA